MLRMLDKEGKSAFLRRLIQSLVLLEIKDEGGNEECKDAKDRHKYSCRIRNTNTVKENGGNECKFRKTVDNNSFTDEIKLNIKI